MIQHILNKFSIDSFFNIFSNYSTDSISDIIYISLFTIFFTGFAFVVIQFLKFRSLQKLIILPLKTKSNQSEAISTISKNIAINKRFNSEWENYKSNLYNPQNSNSYCSKTTAKNYFIHSTLSPKIFHNKTLPIIPSTLTAIGVLGTFGGLLLSLKGISLIGDFETITLSVNNVLHGASTAFKTSFTGISLSLVFNLFYRYIIGEINKGIQNINTSLDQRFPVTQIEDHFLSIATSTYLTSKATSDLGKEIGSNIEQVLTKAIKDMSDNMAEVLDSKLQETFSQVTALNEKLLSKLLNEFVEKFSQIAEQPGKDMLSVLKLLHKRGEEINSMIHHWNKEITKTVDGIADTNQSFISTTEKKIVSLSKSSDQLFKKLSTLIHDLDKKNHDLHSRYDDTLNALGQTNSSINETTNKFNKSIEIFNNINETYKKILVSLQNNTQNSLERIDDVASSLLLITQNINHLEQVYSKIDFPEDEFNAF